MDDAFRARAAILVVDDEPANLRLVARIAHSAGFRRVHTLTDSREAIEAFETLKPDLAVLDLMMPHVDGIGVIRALRERTTAHGSFLPILMLTGDGSREARRRALAAGATDFLTKPLDAGETALRMANLLETRYLALESATRAREVAEAEKRSLAALLANMSHELRTPLHSILGFADVLAREQLGPLNERQRLFVTYLLQAGEHMRGLVDDLLDLRRAEEGAVPMSREAVALKAVIGEAMPLVALGMARGKHAFEMDAAPDAVAWADRRLLVQVLVNLLGNAAKFTPEGGRIVARARAEEGRVRLEVQDNGVGISAEDAPRVFDYFVQVGAKHALAMKGSGVGLALTRKLVELMEGEIGVVSARGEGSTFWVTLPRAVSAEVSERAS